MVIETSYSYFASRVGSRTTHLASDPTLLGRYSPTASAYVQRSERNRSRLGSKQFQQITAGSRTRFFFCHSCVSTAQTRRFTGSKLRRLDELAAALGWGGRSPLSFRHILRAYYPGLQPRHRGKGYRIRRSCYSLGHDCAGEGLRPRWP